MKLGLKWKKHHLPNVRLCSVSILESNKTLNLVWYCSLEGKGLTKNKSHYRKSQSKKIEK